MHILNIDLETYSPLDLKMAGAYKYAEQAEILLFAYSLDGAPVECIDLTKDPLPNWLFNALTDENYLKIAFNAPFERALLNACLFIYTPPEQWECTLVRSAMAGLPLSLDDSSKALGLIEKKDWTGKALIRYFCVPCKPTKANGFRTRNLPEHDPVKWQQFISYCKQDVVTEMAIGRCLSWMKIPQSERHLWCIDQRINEAGVRGDLNFINNAIAANENIMNGLAEEAMRLTGISNPNSIAQLKKWLSAELDEEVTVLNKEEVPKILAKTEDETVSRVLQIRQSMGKTSVTKYVAMRNSIGSDGRIRGLLQFGGANRTMRWAGRLVQIQNLPKSYCKDWILDSMRELIAENDPESLELLFGSLSPNLSQLIRTSFVAAEGSRLIISDYASIEARVAAWLAGEKWALDVYATHGKIYEATASKMFNIPIEKVTKGSEYRAKGKVAVLSCIAKDQLVLTNHGLIPIQNVSLFDKVWDGGDWVTHDGVVFRGYKKVITYEGLTATPDHLVWTEENKKPIQFGESAARGSRLLQSGHGRESVRVDADNISGEALEKRMERAYGSLSMLRVQKYKMDKLFLYDQGYNKRVPALYKTAPNSKMARSKTISCKKQMRKSQRQAVFQLRGKGYPIQFRQCRLCWFMDYRKLGFTRAGYGTRSERQYGSLRTWKHSVGYQKRKLFKQKDYCLEKLESRRMALFCECCKKKTKSRHEQRRNIKGCRGGRPYEKKKLEGYTEKIAVFDILNAGPNHRFTVSNVLVHNCGYGGGKDALIRMGALKEGLKEEDLPSIVSDWRSSNSNIVRFWYEIDEAAKNAIRTREKSPVGKHGIYFKMYNRTLVLFLPSGRFNCYADASLKWGETPIGYREQICYWGISNEPGKPKVWSEQRTYGAKLFENICQSVSRDCLANGLKNLENAGYQTVMHVHDEVVCEMPIGKGSLEEVNSLLIAPLPWMKGLPLRAEGFESFYYKKDND